MKIKQRGYYDILLFAGVVIGVIVTGLSAWRILSHEDHYGFFMAGFGMSLVLFLISWVTLSVFTRDVRKSATDSVWTAGVYFGLFLVTVTALDLVELIRSRLWVTASFTEMLIVSVGMSGHHLSDRKKGVLSGLIISVAAIASIIIFFTVCPP
jgi:hypothetical protein